MLIVCTAGNNIQLALSVSRRAKGGCQPFHLIHKFDSRRTAINLGLGILQRLSLHQAHDGEECADDDGCGDELIQSDLMQ
jgi:hypothetical protein